MTIYIIMSSSFRKYSKLKLYRIHNNARNIGAIHTIFKKKINATIKTSFLRATVTFDFLA